MEDPYAPIPRYARNRAPFPPSDKMSSERVHGEGSRVGAPAKLQIFWGAAARCGLILPTMSPSLQEATPPVHPLASEASGKGATR